MRRRLAPRRRLRRLAGTLVLWLGSTPLAAQIEAGPDAVLFEGATLVDPGSGTVIARSRLWVAEGRIVCVGDENDCPGEPGVVVGLADHWIVPGLIDTHVHLDVRGRPERTRAERRLRFALGITTVRDGGSQLPEGLPERERSERADLPVPRLVVTAHPSTQSAERAGLPRGRSLIEYFAELGVEQIKLKDRLVDDVWVEEMRAARALSLPVWGHTWYGPPPVDRTMQAVEEGLAGVSHLLAIAPGAQPRPLEDVPTLDDPDFYRWRKHLWLTADSARLADLSDGLVAAEVWLEPLLRTEFDWGRLPTVPRHLRFVVAGSAQREGWLGGPRSTAPTYPEPYRRMEAFVRGFHERGGRVVTGTDGGAAGAALHMEIELLQRAGLSPLHALRAATADAAVAVGRPEVGRLVVGALADFVVLGEDPLAEGAILDVVSVAKGGVLHDTRPLLATYRERYDADRRAAWLRRLRRWGLPAVAFGGLLLLGVRWMARVSVARRET